VIENHSNRTSNLLVIIVST